MRKPSGSNSSGIAWMLRSASEFGRRNFSDNCSISRIGRWRARRKCTLAEEHNPLAWIAPILAFVLVGMIWYLLHGILTAREQVINRDVFNVVLGALVTAFTTVMALLFRVVARLEQKGRCYPVSGRLTTNPNIEGGDVGADPDELQVDDSQPAPAKRLGPARQTDDRSTPRWPSGSPPIRNLWPVPAKSARRSCAVLSSDVGVSAVQAAGILGNIGWECGGFKALQEVKPVMGGLGGLGWCQWTAARRTAFVNWLRDNGWGENYHDDEANYGYLLYELHGPQWPSLNAVKGTSMVEIRDKRRSWIFSRGPTRNTRHLDNRIGLARLALQEYGRAFNV